MWGAEASHSRHMATRGTRDGDSWQQRRNRIQTAPASFRGTLTLDSVRRNVPSTVEAPSHEHERKGHANRMQQMQVKGQGSAPLARPRS